MSNNDPGLARRLRAAREQAGLTQAQAARVLGLHRPSISEMEAGRRRGSAEELKGLSDVYDVDPSWLLGAASDVAEFDDRVRLAARELARMAPEDIDAVLRLLRTMRRSDDDT